VVSNVGGNQLLDLLITDHPRPARTGLIEQAVAAIDDEPDYANRRTVVIDKPKRSANSVLVPPPAAANTIRDRIANARGTATTPVPTPPIRARSAAVNTISAAWGVGTTQSNN